MLRTRLSSALHAIFLSLIVLVGSARAQSAGVPTTVSDMPLPGGLRGALAAIGDHTAPDRAQFLVEFIRRTYDTPFGPRSDPREVVVQSLLAQLKAGGATSETLPLPLTPRVWIDVVFGGQATPETLVGAILQSRGAALLYCGLLSLDDNTRAWIARQPDLIAEVVSRRPAAFLAVAPGLRVTPAGVAVPGGALAEPVWHALVGRRPADATDFVRALLASGDGRLAYFFGAMAELTPPQLRLALNLESSDVAARTDSARRLYLVFQRLWSGRTIEQRAFSRPPLDPALLVAELSAVGKGQPSVPGTLEFWNAVFDEARDRRAKPPQEETRATFEGGGPADFAWLCEHIFKADAAEQRRRYMMVLFASRRIGRITRETSGDAVDAVRAVGVYPVLVSALERARVTDIAVFASAVRRARDISTIEEGRAFRLLAQFQGALALITRAASRGSLAPDTVSKLVSSLAAIPISERGDYDGRVVSWLASWINSDTRVTQGPPTSATATLAGPDDDVYEEAAGPTEQAVLRLLAGPTVINPRFIDWEGTRYRLDLARAEAVRMMRALGESRRPYLSSAISVVAIADALADATLTREGLQLQAQALAHVVQEDAALGSEESGGDVLGRYRDSTATVQRAARAGDVRAAARVAPALRLLADDLLASGLMEAAYAAALGQGDGVSPAAGDAASRHDFGLHGSVAPSAPWRPPLPGTDAAQRWRLGGSLLGLDVALANFSLVSLSLRPPPRRPTLGDLDRRAFIDAVALVEPAALTDADRDTIVAAIRRGHARLDRVSTPDAVRAIAEETGLSPLRRTLMAWGQAHDPGRLAVFLSPSELLWLGLENVPIDTLNAWGAPATSRLGCLCLEIIDRRPWESFAGRSNTGMSASAFPDLNLRLAELLSDLHMPAALLGPVLTAATLDFINNVASRDADDRRGLVEFVQTLRTDRVEQYLALLTTEGPLVPMGEVPAAKDPGGPR